MSVYSLDVSKLLCPLPVIKLQNKVKQLSSGDIVEMWCTDPGVWQDVPSWCKIHHHKLIDIQQQDNGKILVKVEVGL